MGKSLYMSVENLHSLQRSLDNFLIAKSLDDAGYPLPPDTKFYTQSFYASEDTLFFKGICALFGGALCFDKNFEEDGYEESVHVSIRIPMIEEWRKLVKGHEQDRQVLDDESYFMKPIEHICCDYWDMSMKCTLVPYGLKIHITGTYGFFNGFIEGLVKFNIRLDEKVREYNRRRDWNGRDPNYPAKRDQFCESRQAV